MIDRRLLIAGCGAGLFLATTLRAPAPALAQRLEGKLSISPLRGGLWRGNEDRAFTDRNNRTWSVPKGFETDVTSMPRLPWRPKRL